MKPVSRALLAFLAGFFRSRMSLQLEIVALRHQLTLYQRSIRRPQYVVVGVPRVIEL